MLSQTDGKRAVNFDSFLDQGPPDGWRGPEEHLDDGAWHEDFPRGDFGPGPEGDGAMRGRGKPRGGRRGRGVRR